MNILRHLFAHELTNALILQFSPPKPPYPEYLLRILMSLLEQFLHWYQGYVTIVIMFLALLLAVNVTALLVALLIVRTMSKKIIWLPVK